MHRSVFLIKFVTENPKFALFVWGRFQIIHNTMIIGCESQAGTVYVLKFHHCHQNLSLLQIDGRDIYVALTVSLNGNIDGSNFWVYEKILRVRFSMQILFQNSFRRLFLFCDMKRRPECLKFLCRDSNLEFLQQIMSLKQICKRIRHGWSYNLKKQSHEHLEHSNKLTFAKYQVRRKESCRRLAIRLHSDHERRSSPRQNFEKAVVKWRGRRVMPLKVSG